ncbi:Uncharacterised protein [Shigella sonnei]|nr:Uncharacterised protein [Shigella sonnei]
MNQTLPTADLNTAGTTDVIPSVMEGRMEGRMEGALEKALAIACQLQKMGMTPEQIKQATGLSDDELKKITH